MLWAIAVAMAGIVVVAIVAPFMRQKAGTEAEPAAAYDLRVYRAQLAEVDRDLTRGTIVPEEGGRLRAEIGRKVLEADRALMREQAAAPHEARRVPVVTMAAAAVALALGALATYQWLGRPAMPDQPLLVRIAAAQQVYDSRPSQAEAEAEAPPLPPQQASDSNYAQLVAQLREVLAKNPDDPRGLQLLAQGEARLGNPAAAVKAMAHLIAIRGADASAADHAQLAGMMVTAAGGIITPEAEAEVAAALQGDPSQPQARYLQGLLMVQNERPDRAFPIWRDLLEDDPSAPWAVPIRSVIGDLAWLAGHPDYEPPPEASAGTSGPDAAQVAAVEAMSPQERQAMIEGMVSQLQERLAAQGGSPQEWAQLVNALRVSGRDDEAGQALTQARTAYAGNADALAIIEAAPGGAAPVTPPAAGDSTSPLQGGAQAIATMTSRLEARLASQGGTPAEWARLITSLVVIGDRDHAQEVLTEAREKFAGDRSGLAAVEAAADEVGLR